MLCCILLADNDKPKAPKKNATPKGDSKKNATAEGDSKKNATPKGDMKKNVTPKGATERKKTPKAASPRPPAKRRILDEPASSPKGNKQMKLTPNVTYKAFNKLLEDVEFAISGYVNPGRADIRAKALEMGAKYRTDWTPTCTHLM